MNGWAGPERWSLMLLPGPARPAQVAVRIGDAERDAAIGALGDHFAAGRLTREEFDERVDAALAARFQLDLEPLFADLPVASSPSDRRRPARSPHPLSMGLLIPVIVVAVMVAAISLGGPWVLWALLWMFLASRLWRRHHRRHGPSDDLSCWRGSSWSHDHSSPRT